MASSSSSVKRGRGRPRQAQGTVMCMCSHFFISLIVSIVSLYPMFSYILWAWGLKRCGCLGVERVLRHARGKESDGTESEAGFERRT